LRPAGGAGHHKGSFDVRYHQLVAGACLCFLSASAQAAPSEAAVRWFDSFDQDKDAVITPDEYTAVAEKQFGRVDGNGDGVVDQGEYIFGIPEGNDEEIERAQKRFVIMDRNGDGGATQEEFVAFGHQVIQLSDTDSDGKMTMDEFAASVSPSD
jgi:Ca2+-binding EF-hand superfamily protein